MPINLHHKTAGFSLVELSIAMVIIGLLVGGILAGQSLIHASELRSTIAQVQTYLTAVNIFQEKYSAIPRASELGLVPRRNSRGEMDIPTIATVRMASHWFSGGI